MNSITNQKHSIPLKRSRRVVSGGGEGGTDGTSPSTSSSNRKRFFHPSSSSSSSSSYIRRRRGIFFFSSSSSPYTLLIIILTFLLLLLSFWYMIYVFSFLTTSSNTNTHSNPADSDNTTLSQKNIQDPYQLLHPNPIMKNNNNNVQGHVQFDAHNFLHQKQEKDEEEEKDKHPPAAVDTDDTLNHTTITVNRSSSSFQSQSTPPPPLIHIVHTRFMQHQGSLTHLAQARFFLFQTFCLPTLIHQTNQNFLWFIQVDPQLNSTILQSLIQVVQPYSNFFIIASLENYWIGSTKNGSWRNGIEGIQIWSHVYKEEIYTGNLDLILSAIQMEDKDFPILLETRLDADDGLHVHFIESIQQDAIHIFTASTTATATAAETSPTPTLPRWIYWCSKQYIVWLYESSTTYNMNDDLQLLRGTVELREMIQDECITPGLTIGMNRRTTYEEVPQYDHNQLYQQIVLSNNKAEGGGCGTKTRQECIRFWKDSINHSTTNMLLEEKYNNPMMYLSAIRARTLTSAGMKDITPQQYKQRQQQEKNSPNINSSNSSSELWSIMTSSTTFSISTLHIKQTYDYISTHMVQIAKENLQGQCRGQHSCKESSQFLLQQIMMIDSLGNTTLTTTNNSSSNSMNTTSG